jgi:hypothetical protein
LVPPEQQEWSTLQVSQLAPELQVSQLAPELQVSQLAPELQVLRLARKRLAPRRLVLGTLRVLPAPQEWDWIVLRQPSYKYDLNFAGLSVFVPLNTDGFAWAFPRACVG